MTAFQCVMVRIGALLALGVLAACTVVVDEGGPPSRPRAPMPQMCTMEYNPVCAQRGNNRRTFANACQARADGYRIIDGGQCRPERPDFGGDRPQVCTREYAPVCARQGRSQRTFSNACMAEGQGYRVIGRGECGGDEGRPDVGERPGRDPDQRPPQACTREYAPVCARQGRQRQTFPNACTAQAEGFRVIDNNPCQ